MLTVGGWFFIVTATQAKYRRLIFVGEHTWPICRLGKSPSFSVHTVDIHHSVFVAVEDGFKNFFVFPCLYFDNLSAVSHRVMSYRLKLNNVLVCWIPLRSFKQLPQLSTTQDSISQQKYFQSSLKTVGQENLNDKNWLSCGYRRTIFLSPDMWANIIGQQKSFVSGLILLLLVFA